MPILTQYTAFTSKTAEQLQALLYPRTGDPQMSNQRIVDVLTAINGGQISGNIKVQIAPVQGVAQLQFSAVTQPTAGGTFTFNNNVYTLVNSSPTGRQFLKGSTNVSTANNLAAVFNADVTNRGVAIATVNPITPVSLLVTLASANVNAVLNQLGTNLSSCTVTAFTGMSDGSTVVQFAEGIATNNIATNNSNFKVVIQSNDTAAQMLQYINPQPSSPSQSTINLIGLHNTLGVGRSAYMSVTIGSGFYSGSLVFLNNPQAGQVFNLGKFTYTAVASGATGLQFNIDASLATTVSNLVTTIQTNINSNSQFLDYAIDASNAPAVVVLTITTKSPGSSVSGMTFSSNFDGIIVNQMTGSPGNTANLSLGLPAGSFIV